MMEKMESIKKDVVITIVSRQNFEGCEPDQVDLITTGRLYGRNGKFYISYEESELTGMEGSRTTLKIEPKQITMTRTGTYPSQMRFAEHERQVGLYQTELGEVAVSTHTSQLTSSIDENGGALAIDYTVEIDASLAGAHRFELSVRPS
ncbi:MAG: DUF1934 domain-containing protein [Eubacteriales bacterium]|nr:DUF1934 domain-containing protein [Eubacteriales bacterium]